jgi:hypothetical protein
MASSQKSKPLKAHFFRVELNKTEWEVPDRYQNLAAVGAGAYGQVWYVLVAVVFVMGFVIHHSDVLCMAP